MSITASSPAFPQTRIKAATIGAKIHVVFDRTIMAIAMPGLQTSLTSGIWITRAVKVVVVDIPRAMATT